MVYSGDVYLSGKEICKNARIMEKNNNAANTLFFYDTKNVSHFVMGDITVCNTNDTTFVNK